jgi:signal transduction histidine kinase
LDFDLTQIMHMVLQSFTEQFKSRSIQTQIIGSQVFPVHGLSMVFQEIIPVFLQNALDHAWPDCQNGTITMAYGHVHEKKHWAFLEIRDDGCGIPTGVRERIFEPFFTTRRSLGSVGLGLNIVRNFVTMSLQGTITLADTDSCGTCFRIEFPL